jgi:hypothetical protein
VNATLAAELIAMREHDLAVRKELEQDGSLFAGYHPRMEAVHRDNAARLRAIIAEHGWPSVPLVGQRGALSAWLIAQHAIGEPAFMRQCRDLLEGAVAAGAAPAWQLAYLDDRIRVFENKPQRYGTQLRAAAGGSAEPCPLEDAARVDVLRADVGLPPLAKTLAQARPGPPLSPEAQAAKDAGEREWRKRVGWSAD